MVLVTINYDDLYLLERSLYVTQLPINKIASYKENQKSLHPYSLILFIDTFNIKFSCIYICVCLCL